MKESIQKFGRFLSGMVMPLTAIDDFEELGKNNELFKLLADSCKEHRGLWNSHAEQILLNYNN